MTDQLLSVFAVLLFITSVYLFSNSAARKLPRIAFGIGVFIYAVLFAAHFVADYFTANGFDESVIYHIRYGLGGAGFGEYINVIIASCIAIAVAASMAIYVIVHKPLYRRKKSTGRSAVLAITAALAIVMNPLIRNIICSTHEVKGSEGDFSYYDSLTGLKEISKDKPNFVFIYLEGLERTYFNEDLFPGLINGLRELEKTSVSFTNIVQATETGWTIGGMVASQCGVPLFTPSHGNSMAGMDKFLANAVCLGDLLNEKGYYLSYLGGDDLKFAGKGKFFKTHGFSEVKGKNELRSRLDNQSYMSDWGLYDDSLFDAAYERVVKFSKSGRPFGLFLLTLDTHPPEGHKNRSTMDVSYGDGANPMLNAVAGADFLAGQFVRKIRESEFGNNTVIIIASDHLAMNSTAYGLLEKADRKNLFMINTPGTGNGIEVNRLGTTLDISTTLLPFLGYSGHIGFGRNLLAEDSLEYSLGGITGYLLSSKKELLTLWRFPTIKERVSINPVNKTVRIDDRVLKYPLLIELNKDLATDSIEFEFYNNPWDKSLRDHLQSLEEGRRFIWIDSCDKLRQNYGITVDHDCCAFIGRANNAQSKRTFAGEIISSDGLIVIDKNRIAKILSI